MIKENIKTNNKFRQVNFTSIISMSLVLFLVGLLCLILFTARDMSIHVKENISLSVILNDDIDQAYQQRIQKYLDSAPYVKSQRFISKDEALKELIASLGEDPKAFLGYNPLLASFEVKLKADYANPDSVQIIESKLKNFEHINRIAYQKDLVSLVNDNVKKISLVLLALVIILTVISLVLINNTVRLTVYSNRFLINTMKLVGATPGFIRKPYIVRGIINGLIAALIALVFLGGMIYYVLREFAITGMEFNMFTILYVVLTVVLLGILLTAVSSHMAVSRFIRMKTDQIYSM